MAEVCKKPQLICNSTRRSGFCELRCWAPISDVSHSRRDLYSFVPVNLLPIYAIDIAKYSAHPKTDRGQFQTQRVRRSENFFLYAAWIMKRASQYNDIVKKNLSNSRKFVICIYIRYIKSLWWNHELNPNINDKNEWKKNWWNSLALVYISVMRFHYG